MASVKWLTDIELISSSFSGYFHSERYFYEWQHQGTITREPVRLQRVRSLITEPRPNAVLPAGNIVIRGVAWSGAAPIAGVDICIDDGPWMPAQLLAHRPEHGWLWWELLTRLERRGATIVRARATDRAGRVQPELPEWNRLGYGGNAIHALDIHIE